MNKLIYIILTLLICTNSVAREYKVSPPTPQSTPKIMVRSEALGEAA